jgi:hypothetical protein
MSSQHSNRIESEDDFIEELPPNEDSIRDNISASQLVIQPKIETVQTEEVVQVWRQLTANVLGFVKGIVDRYSTESIPLISIRNDSFI